MRIKFDGKDLEIKPLNLNQLIEVEEKCGSLQKAASSGAVPLKTVRFLAYVMIHPVLPDLTEEQIGEKLDMDSITEIAKASSPVARVGADRPSTSA